MKRYVYFDNAATTIGKPECVGRAMTAALERLANPGRSGHDLSYNAAAEIYECRKAVCRLFGYDKPDRVVFTHNATYALNMAIKGYAVPGCHILISNYEHNSVIRPVHALASDPNLNISYTVFDAGGSDSDILYDFSSKIKPNTRIAAVTLASNVCGKILPIAKLADICRKRGILMICDASQAAGCVPINVTALGIDVLCFAGHKSLYGPQGTGGALFCTAKDPVPVIQGGNGINSADKNMSGELPERLEGGTLNTPGICGLAAGIGYISKIGINEIFERNRYLIDRLTDNLQSIHGVTLYGVTNTRTPTVLFNKAGLGSEEAARLLNERGICVRGGFHCAPLAHTALNTGEYGAIRASLSFTNTPSETDTFALAVSKL
ncbi:MAG: aminotransferase class V-fold PLP-dependent enzyme [Eubacteriales bacterium]